MITTIQINKKTKENLDKLKIHNRETYNEVIERMFENCAVGSVDRESLIATIEILSDPVTMKEIKESLERIEKGDYGTPLEELEKELNL